MRLSKGLFKSFFHLFYPHICVGCGSDIMQDDDLLCLKCVTELPHADFASYPGNAVEKIFWGRTPLNAAMAEFYFAKGTIIQHLIHQFKYKGNKEIGLYFGAMMGSSLLNNPRFQNIDALIPMPLFPQKEQKRGYNQAAILCKGMSEVMAVPVITGNIVRKRFTDTQTRKHRIERWENVVGSFDVTTKNELKGKHILLVDDVTTTGATLEACAMAILKVEDVTLSIATLALATR